MMNTIIDIRKKALRLDLKHYCKRGHAWESAENWERFLSVHFFMDFDFFDKKVVLEVGCGAYGAIHYIPCFRVGIDPLCSAHNDIYKRHSIFTHHVEGIGELLPFKKEVFDVTVSFNAIDHGISPEKVIKEVKKVLRPGGIFLLHVHTFNLPSFVRFILFIVDRPHPHHLSNKEVLLCLRSAGFRVNHLKIDKICIKSSFIDFIKRFDKGSSKTFIASVLGIRNSFYTCERGEK